MWTGAEALLVQWTGGSGFVSYLLGRAASAALTQLFEAHQVGVCC